MDILIILLIFLLLFGGVGYGRYSGGISPGLVVLIIVLVLVFGGGYGFYRHW